MMQVEEQPEQQSCDQEQEDFDWSSFIADAVPPLAKMACDTYLKHKDQEAKFIAERDERWQKYRKQETDH